VLLMRLVFSMKNVKIDKQFTSKSNIIFKSIIMSRYVDSFIEISNIRNSLEIVINSEWTLIFLVILSFLIRSLLLHIGFLQLLNVLLLFLLVFY